MARRDAKKNGTHYREELFRIIRKSGARDADKIAAIKHLDDLLIPKMEEGGEADRHLGPAIFLPEHRPVLAAINGGLKDARGTENG